MGTKYEIKQLNPFSSEDVSTNKVLYILKTILVIFYGLDDNSVDVSSTKTKKLLILTQLILVQQKQQKINVFYSHRRATFKGENFIDSGIDSFFIEETQQLDTQR